MSQIIDQIEEIVRITRWRFFNDSDQLEKFSLDEVVGKTVVEERVIDFSKWNVNREKLNVSIYSDGSFLIKSTFLVHEYCDECGSTPTGEHEEVEYFYHDGRETYFLCAAIQNLMI